jgi:hypothetical protein
MAISGVCLIPNCGKPVRVKSRGWCRWHWEQWRRHGDPNIVVNTPMGEPHRFFRETVLTFAGHDCLIWPFAKSSGYGRIWLDGRQQSVTRLACEHVNGPPPTSMHDAAHSCGKAHEGCCNPRHLSWKTQTENEQDKLIHGTRSRGERCGRSKLTADDVREVRAMKAAGAALREIAVRHNVHSSTIGLIVRRKSWAWLD